MYLNKGEQQFVLFLPELVENKSIPPTPSAKVRRLELLPLSSLQKIIQIKRNEFLILQYWKYVHQQYVICKLLRIGNAVNFYQCNKMEHKALWHSKSKIRHNMRQNGRGHTVCIFCSIINSLHKHGQYLANSVCGPRKVYSVFSGHHFCK
jgi:hypothetical protein